MGLCVSIPIQQSLNDEIREIQNQAFTQDKSKKN
jgi:hypothetical protein